MRISKRLPSARSLPTSAVGRFHGLLFILLLALPSRGDETRPFLDRVYLKNNSPYRAHIWIKNRYQGQVAPGEVRCADQDGDHSKGDQAGGWRLPGEWYDSPDPVVIQISLQTNEGTWISTSIVPTVNKYHFGYVWFGDKSPGKEPLPKEWMNPRAIDYFSKPEPRKEDCISTVSAYAATEPDSIGAWQASITENVNAKIRAGDYQGGLSYLYKVKRELPSDDPLSNHAFLDRMISQLHDFINKKH